jgi:hypothetical protein
MDFSSETVIHHYMRKIPKKVFRLPFTSFVGARRAVPLRLSFSKLHNLDSHSRANGDPGKAVQNLNLSFGSSVPST